MDYRDLLKRYMNHVGFEEGSTFTGVLEGGAVAFTPEEIAELRAIDKEGEAEFAITTLQQAGEAGERGE